MNKGIIGAIGFVSGLAIGYILGNKSIIDKFKSTKVEEVIEFTPEKKNDSEGDKEKTTPSKFEKPELDQLVKKYRIEEDQYTDYSENKREPYPPEDYLSPEEDDDEEEDIEPELHEEVKFSKPEIISLHEFENEKKNYETCTLTYYVWDDTVCDDHDNVITSPEDLIGDDALLCFGLGSNDSNTVYVCNDTRGTKYEIVKVDNSYQESVLGLKNIGLSVNKKRREDIDSD